MPKSPKKNWLMAFPTTPPFPIFVINKTIENARTTNKSTSLFQGNPGAVLLLRERDPVCFLPEDVFREAGFFFDVAINTSHNCKMSRYRKNTCSQTVNCEKLKLLPAYNYKHRFYADISYNSRNNHTNHINPGLGSRY